MSRNGPTRQHKPLWTCPKCGHRFVTRNLWHSCVRVPLDEHFKSAGLIVRRMFNRYVALARRCGPVTVYAQKTRIVIMVRMRFAGGRARRKWFDATMVLTRPAKHPALRRIEFIPPHYHVHYFRLTRLSDIDQVMGRLMQRAYAVGCQQPRLPRRSSRARST